MTFEDIKNRLGITKMQLKMLIYSGAIPPAKIEGEWCQQELEQFLTNLEARAERTKNAREKGSCE